MPRLAANLSWLFTELPFERRFAAASQAGFRAVEMLFPYELPPARVRALLDANGLDLVLLNLPPGNWDAGNRGLAAIPGRETEFDAAVALAREYARVCGCPRVHAMAGHVPDGVARSTCNDAYVSNLRRAAHAFAADGVTVLIEPLNVVENPTYLLHTTGQAIATLESVGEANLKLQLDLYHTQITEGDLERHIRRLHGRFSHVQIAGNPHRNEPDTGEVNYRYVLDVLDEIGFDGWEPQVRGCAARTIAGLRRVGERIAGHAHLRFARIWTGEP